MKRDYTGLIKELKKINPTKLDSLFLDFHEEEFAEIDCLECGNCCKSLGPRLLNIDIERLSAHLKIKSSVFVDKYLRIDEDNDFVFKTMPCPFLMEDNFCIVYKSRPKACREYPHTNQKNIKSILTICEKNTLTCPVVFNIFEKLDKLTSK
jgi:Fe-S-cluster containining protein